MTKVPFSLRFEVIPDATGLSFGKAVAIFHYYYEEDHNAMVTDKVVLNVEGESLKAFDDLFETVLEAAISKHACVSKADAMKKMFCPDIESKPNEPIAAVVESVRIPVPLLARQAQAEPNMWGKVKDFILGR